MIRPLPAVPTWLWSLLIPFKSIFPLLGEFPKTKLSVIAKIKKTATQVLQLSHSRSYSDRNISAWIREGLQGPDKENLPCEANRNILNPSAMYCSSKTCIIKVERQGRKKHVIWGWSDCDEFQAVIYNSPLEILSLLTSLTEKMKHYSFTLSSV